MKIVFICETCRYHNKVKLGTPGYEVVPHVFETFSDAVVHILENRGHWMEAEIKEAQ